jgi:hypothetical protein
MAKPPRDRTSLGTDVYFVTASAWGHRSLFQTDRMAQLFLDMLFHYRTQKKFLLHQFVIMPGAGFINALEELSAGALRG